MAMWGLKTRLLHRLPRVLFSKLFRDQDQDHEEAPKLKDALQFSGWLWVGGGGGWSNHSRFIAFAILPSHPLLLTGNWRLPNPLKCRIFYYRKESSSLQKVFFSPVGHPPPFVNQFFGEKWFWNEWDTLLSCTPLFNFALSVSYLPSFLGPKMWTYKLHWRFMRQDLLLLTGRSWPQLLYGH